MDYFERAKRVEEIPLLEKQAESDAAEMKAHFEKQQADRVSTRANTRQTTSRDFGL